MGTFEQEFPGLSESANACTVALSRASQGLLARLDKGLRHHRLSGAARQALAIIEGAGRPLSPTTIAERLIVTTASVTSLLDTLSARGLVERNPDPQDRRKVLVTLTEEGQALVDEFLPEIVALQTAVMAGLSETQRTQLLKLLAIVQEGVDNVDPEAVVTEAPRRGKRRPLDLDA